MKHKITVEEVLHIWKLEKTRKTPTVEPEIIWIEIGQERNERKKPSGYIHFLKHKDEFGQLGIQPDQFLELVEAATKVGLYIGQQKSKKKKARPIFGLRFYSTPLFVAITVATNGYVVGMNPSNTKRSTMELDLSDESLPSWPPEPSTSVVEKSALTKQVLFMLLFFITLVIFFPFVV